MNVFIMTKYSELSCKIHSCVPSAIVSLGGKQSRSFLVDVDRYEMA